MKRYKSLFRYKEDEIVEICLQEDEAGGRFCGDANYLLIEKVIDNSVELSEIGDILSDNQKILQNFSLVDDLISFLNNVFDNRKIKFIYTPKDTPNIIPVGSTSIKNQYIFIYCSDRLKELLDSKGDETIFDEFLQDVFRILGHELVHREQMLRVEQKNLLTTIHRKSTNDQQNYFSNTYEIMAYAWQIVNTLRLTNLSDSSIKKILSLNSKTKLDLGGEILQIYHQLFKDTSPVLKRLYKQMYEYLSI